MTHELEILELVCKKLEDAGISYMITGSFASNFYTVARLTRDLDIVVQILEPDVEKFVQAFQRDFYFSKESMIEALKHQGMFNIIHQETVFKIDFIIRKNSSYRITEFHRRSRLPLGESLIWVVSQEDLIISKLDWAKDSLSKTQLNDVKNIIQSSKALDQTYLDKWIKELDLTDVYSQVPHA